MRYGYSMIRSFGLPGILCFVALLSCQPSKAHELVIPALEYRTGPYASSGIPFWNGFIDYLTLLNERDGGIKGTKIKIVRCETAYDVQRGVDCYQSLKALGPLIVSPVSTGITYKLIELAPADKIPVLSAGYGRTSASDGRIFKWVFNFPATYWSAASIMVKYIGEQERGLAGLRGKTIGLAYLDNAYGREPIPTLTALAAKHGFEFLTYPIAAPGLDQAAVWDRIGKEKPDWILFWGYGNMNPLFLKNAVAAHFPMGRIIGIWWASGENDIAGLHREANGYLGAALHAPGAVSPVHSDIARYVYERGRAVDPSFKGRIGEVLYNRGLATAMWTAEAIRLAMDLRGKAEITGEDVRDGLERLDLSEERIEELGFEGMLSPLKITCANHEGPGRAAIQQWDAERSRWRLVSGFMEPDHATIAPLVEAGAAAYAKERGITPRDCQRP